MALALILISACSSKGDSKDKKVKETSATKTTAASEDGSDEEASEDESQTAPESTAGTEGTAADTSEKSLEELPTVSPEETTEASDETTAAPEETAERNEADYVFDLTGMTAEEIADICDSLTTRKIPKVGDKLSEVRKNYYDREPWKYTLAFCGRYGGLEKDNVNCIYVSGVYVEGSEEEGGPFVRNIDRFGTGIVLEIYDYTKAEEFIRIMKERHPVLEEKPGGSWRGEDFVIGITPIDFFYYENGVHFQIAYGEKSDWYESVSGFFGFGFEISAGDTTEETTI